MAIIKLTGLNLGIEDALRSKAKKYGFGTDDIELTYFIQMIIPFALDNKELFDSAMIKTGYSKSYNKRVSNKTYDVYVGKNDVKKEIISWGIKRIYGHSKPSKPKLREVALKQLKYILLFFVDADLDLPKEYFNKKAEEYANTSLDFENTTSKKVSLLVDTDYIGKEEIIELLLALDAMYKSVGGDELTIDEENISSLLFITNPQLVS